MALNLTDTTRDLIDVLNRHLANGLGAATRIDDADHYLKQVKRD